MTWTVIFRSPDNKNSLSTEVIHGPWGKNETFSFVSERIKSDIVAIVAGDQVIHFNEPVVASLLDRQDFQ